jgi:hypothetical protein
MITSIKRYSLLCIFLLLFSFFLIHPSSSFALDCGVASIKAGSGGDNWDLNYCVGSSAKDEVSSIASVKVTCRSAPGQDVLGQTIAITNLSCHESWQDSLFLGNEAISQTRSITPSKIVYDDAKGVYYTCFSVNSLDRNMGNVEISTISSDGTSLCNEKADVTPGNYSWSEYFDNTLESRFNIDIITNPLESGTNIFCIDGKSVNTALGCIDTEDPKSFISALLLLGTGLGGGIALALMLYGVFVVTTSAGMPDKLNAGKEIITSAVAGLIFILLAVFLVNLIGINILGIPGLT